MKIQDVQDAFSSAFASMRSGASQALSWISTHGQAAAHKAAELGSKVIQTIKPEAEKMRQLVMQNKPHSYVLIAASCAVGAVALIVARALYNRIPVAANTAQTNPSGTNTSVRTNTSIAGTVV